MAKRRGGKNSEQARRGGPEPEAENSGSEDEPMGEPPLPTPYLRLSEGETQTTGEPSLDQGTQTIEITVCQGISGYTPRGEQDRVMLSRKAMEESKVIVQCAKCKAGTIVDVIVIVALCKPLPCESCGYALVRPASEAGGGR